MPRRKVVPETEPAKVVRQTSSQSRSSNTPAKVGAFFIVTVFVIGGAIFLGRSDKGQIDVNQAILNSNQENIAAGGDPANNLDIVSDALRNMPNGGLVPQENQPPQDPPPLDPGTEASTTGDQASTTEDAAKTDGEQVDEREADNATVKTDPANTQDGGQ